MSEVVDIESAGSHIGSDKESDDTVAEFLHDNVALLLAEVAMERVGIISVGNEMVGDFLSVATCAAEDDGVYIGVVIGNTLEREIFVARVDHVVYMAYVFSAFIARAHHNFLGIFHESLGNLGYLGRHCSREEEHLAVLGHMRQNVVDRIDKAHVEHFVGFIEHDGVHVLELHYTTVYEVDETARSGHNDLDAFLERTDLALDARAAVDWQYLEFGYVF